MAKTISQLLQLAWDKQAEYIQGLSCRELEVLLSMLSQAKPEEKRRETYEKFFLAVYSVLRDCREGQAGPGQAGNPQKTNPNSAQNS